MRKHRPRAIAARGVLFKDLDASSSLQGLRLGQGGLTLVGDARIAYQGHENGPFAIKDIANKRPFDSVCMSRSCLLAIFAIHFLEREMTMGTMNISLPDPMKSWVEEQAKTGRYANSSDYVRDLIRRDRARREAVAEIQAAVDVGLASGPAAPLDRSTFKSRMRAEYAGE